MLNKESIERMCDRIDTVLDRINYGVDTLSEYIRDSAMLGQDKAILAIGHFNVEEPGMEYMLEWLDEAIGEKIEAHYVQATDMYEFII